MNLIDIVNQKAESMDVQYSKAQVVPVDEIPWRQTQARVEALPVRFDQIEAIVKKLVSVRDAVKTSSYGKCGKEKCFENTTRIEVLIEGGEFPIQFISYSCPVHGTKNAHYVAINDQKSTVYRKKLLQNYEPQI